MGAGLLTASLLGSGLLGAGGCSADRGGQKPPPDTSVVDFDPGPAPIRRLLARQYVNSVAALLGPEAATLATPPEDQTLNGFESIAAAQLSMTDALVRQYETSARAVAAVARALGTLHDHLDCTPTGPDDAACLQGFVESFGRRVFRRPLSDEEVADYLDLGLQAASTLEAFDAGLEFVAVGMLQSPHFLFLVELGHPIAGHPASASGKGVHRLDGYEVASRMSYFLLEAPPSEELLDAAAAGELDTLAGIRKHAEVLVSSADARRATRSFFEEYLVLGELDGVAKSPTLFPEFSAELAAAMKEETMQLVTDIIHQRDAAISELFTASYTFVDATMADHYGLPAPESGWQRVDLPASAPRPGLLGQASIATAQAHPDSTSVTHRGLFVVERFLCSTMPPPPQGVVPELPPSSVAPTMRERVAVHLEEPACASCHAISDPVGLALENLDPIGRWRDKENGVTIDASVEHADLGTFDGIAGLGEALANEPEVTSCMLRQLYRYATGHVELAGELPALEALHEAFEAGGQSFRSLLVDMVASEVYRHVMPPAGALELADEVELAEEVEP
ncbi:MAG: DUF1592 domain-containing protein [Polyangiaceae bacterium]